MNGMNCNDNERGLLPYNQIQQVVLSDYRIAEDTARYK